MKLNKKRGRVLKFFVDFVAVTSFDIHLGFRIGLICRKSHLIESMNSVWTVDLIDASEMLQKRHRVNCICFIYRKRKREQSFCGGKMIGREKKGKNFR